MPLKARLLEQLAETRLATMETLERLSAALEFRDVDTGGHIRRMAVFAGAIARAAKIPNADLIELAAPMHDVGKFRVPDGLLLKPGPLAPEEFAVIKLHPKAGYDILYGSRAELVQVAADIAYTHHERVDGTGYPQQLHAEQIPICGRVCALADVWDALTHERVYKPAISGPKALAMMRKDRGSHFDAQLFDVFEKLAYGGELEDPPLETP